MKGDPKLAPKNNKRKKAVDQGTYSGSFNNF